MKNSKSALTVLTLANASELTYGIIIGIVGNEVADTISGSPINKEVVHNLLLSQVRSELVAKTLGV